MQVGEVVMKKNIITQIAMILVLLLAAPWTAQAVQMEVSYTLGKNVSYYLNGQKNSSATVQFDASLKNYGTGGQDFNAIGYCVDLGHTIHQNTLYEVGNLQQFTSFDQNQKEAAWLIHTYSPGLGYNSNYSLKTTIAALQAAVWSIVYDTSTSRFDIDSGNFYLDAGWSGLKQWAIRSLAQSMLNTLPTINGGTIGLGSITWSANAKDVYKYGTESRAQELMLASKSVPTTVPEPGTMILFGSALFGVGYMRRRKNKKN
jgi:hypothetical protein